MSTLLYRFDHAEAFPLLKSESTARGPVTVRVERRDENAILRIAVRRKSSDAAEMAVLIGLPLLAIDGNPQRLLFDVLGDASGCSLFLEAGDARGWGLAYSFGPVDFSGWHSHSADVQEPCEYWGTCKAEGTRGAVPPLQPYRLRLTMNETCRAVDIGLGPLSVTGDVRLAPSGIAGDINTS